MPLLFCADLSMKMDRWPLNHMNYFFIIKKKSYKICIKISKMKRGKTMCEFEGVCIFEDGEECDKNNPSQCPNWVIMMGEMGEG